MMCDIELKAAVYKLFKFGCARQIVCYSASYFCILLAALGKDDRGRK